MSPDTHAFLVMAHADEKLLSILLSLLDDPRNDVFLHIDARSDLVLASVASVLTKARVTLTKRRKLNWGCFSQVQCELDLLKEATRRRHAYYHLISGADLPLANQDSFHQFFSEHRGKEFVHFVPGKVPEHVLQRARTRRLFSESSLRNGSGYPYRVRRQAEQILARAQQLGRPPAILEDLHWGSQWFSITHELAEFTVSKEAWIHSNFGRTANADEAYLQTLVANSRFRQNLHVPPDSPARNGSARLIDWTRSDGPSPHTWTTADIATLRKGFEQGYVFARKFNSSVDHQVIDEVVRMVQQ